MAYELPKLPYAYDALVPHIDAKTMEIHHGKHHQAYITNANNVLKDHAELAALSVNALIADLSKVPDAVRGALRNNAGGHSNHAFFWTILGAGKGGTPKGKLADAINATFGSFDNVQGGIRQGRDHPLWFRLGLARRRCRQEARGWFHRQSGQPAHGQSRRRHRG
jgi:superoxide dismutase